MEHASGTDSLILCFNKHYCRNVILSKVPSAKNPEKIFCYSVLSFVFQSIRASGLVLLETILFGSLLLYFPVSQTINFWKNYILADILKNWINHLGENMNVKTLCND